MDELNKAKALLAAAEERTLQAGLALGSLEKRRAELNQQLQLEREELTRAEAREVEARISGISGSAVDPAIADRAARNVRGTEAAVAAMGLQVDDAKVTREQCREAENALRRDVARLAEAEAIAAAAPVLERLVADLSAAGGSGLVYEVLAAAQTCRDRSSDIAPRLERMAEQRRSAAAERLATKPRRRPPVEPVEDTLVYTLRPVSYATPSTSRVLPSHIIAAVPRAVADRAVAVGALRVVPAVAWFKNPSEADVQVPSGDASHTVRAGRAAALPEQSGTRAGLVFTRPADLDEVRAFAAASPSWLASFAGTSRLGNGDRSAPVQLGTFDGSSGTNAAPLGADVVETETETEGKVPPVPARRGKQRATTSTEGAAA